MREKTLAFINERIATGHWEDFQAAKGAMDLAVELEILDEGDRNALCERLDPNNVLYRQPLT